jgi:hypothetical protein
MGAVPDAPRQHSGVVGGVLVEPEVGVEVVLHDDVLPVTELRLEDKAGVGDHLGVVVAAVRGEDNGRQWIRITTNRL